MENIRLPRFRRASNIPSIRLTERDLEILRHVRRHRFLHSAHIGSLLPGSHQQLLRRLRLLYHHGYLERPRAQLDYFHRAGSQPMVYGLGSKSRFLLKDPRLDGCPPGMTANNSVGRLFLQHALLVSDVMVPFEIACRASGDVRLFPSEQMEPGGTFPELADRFRWTATLDDSAKVGVVPDRTFALEFSGIASSTNRVLFFLEADCGTMPVIRRGLQQSSFYRKLLAYEATWRQRIHESRFGFPRFRVLTVTTSAKRTQHLLEACRKLERGQGLFLFTDIDALAKQGDPLSLPWQTARGTTESIL